MADELDWSRIANYVAGAASDEDRRAFEARLASDPELRERVVEAQRIWNGATLGVEGELAGDWDLDAAWLRVVRRDDEAPASSARHVVPVDRLARRRRFVPAKARTWAAAAAILVVAGAALLGRTVTEGSRGTSTSAQAEMYVVTTTAGQRLDLRMPDGSRVVLGAASTLRYPRVYGRARRDVYLVGHAYFEVAHDATRPFAVYAAHAVARDLGTRFDVRAYADDDRVAVAVVEGEVELAARGGVAPRAGKPVRLTAGRLGHVSADGAVTSGPAGDLSQYMAWTEGRLAFTDIPLRDVLPELSRWYDVRFELADTALGNRRFTGTFRDESLSEVVQFLTLSVGATYQRNGRTITVTQRP